MVMPNTTDTHLTKLLSTLRPLEGLSQGNLKELARHVNSIKVPAKKMVFKRNQVNQHYYYLLDGKVELLDAQFQIQPIVSEDDQARAPLDTANPYQHSAITQSDSTLLQVSKDKLDLVLTWNQAGNYLVTDVGADDVLENDWMSCLLGSRLFQQIPPANLQQLFSKFNERPMSAGQRVITEGDPGDAFFVIQQGRVQILRYQEAGRERQVIAELGPGEYFGEEALIGNTVRNASAEMISNGTLMVLGKEDFKKLLEEPVVQYVTESELNHWSSLGKAFKFLDVRLPVEIVASDRKNRLIITLADLRNHLQQLDDAFVYVLCPEAGRRAVLGAYLLQQSGLKAVVQASSSKIKH